MQRRDSNEDERDGAIKKPRVVWSVEMHQQFVNAVNQLGVDSKFLLPAFLVPADNTFHLASSQIAYGMSIIA